MIENTAVSRTWPVQVILLARSTPSLSAPSFCTAAWLRAWPIQTARECLAMNDAPADAPVTLIAEMEYLAADDPARVVRLRAYEQGGFRKVDPAVVAYYQPDFRAFEVIDATGGARPLAFQLVVRQVGREGRR